MTHFLVDLGDLLALVVQEQEMHQILIISLGKRVGQQDFAAGTNGIKIPLFLFKHGKHPLEQGFVEILIVDLPRDHPQLRGLQ